MAESAERHDGQAPFTSLQADVGPVKMKAKLWIEPQSRIASRQQQLVERRHTDREIWAISERAATIDYPAVALGSERLCRVFGCDQLADPVNTCDADWTKPPFGLSELLHEASVRTTRQENILVDADDEFVRGPLETLVQAIDRARAVLDHEYLVRRVGR
jgi:hypothetical protein